MEEAVSLGKTPLRLIDREVMRLDMWQKISSRQNLLKNAKCA